VRLLVAWLALSLLGIIAGRQLITLLLPFFSEIINAMSSDYSHVLDIVQANGETMIEITATIIHPIKATHSLMISPGKTLIASIHVVHVLVPVVILLTLIAAWPVDRPRTRLQLLLLSVPMGFIILSFTTPSLLAGYIERQIGSLILSVGGTPEEPFLFDWIVFQEMGGRWLLPIVGAVFCVALSNGIDNLREEFHSIGNSGSAPTKPRKTKQEKKLEKKLRKKHSVSDI
jgi:hypothetical protein